jgi:hypothetical protein
VTTLFRQLGVDYVQWRAVTRTLLRTDFRLPLMDDASSRGRLQVLTMGVVLGFYGLGAALVVVASPDVLLTGTIVLAYLSMMLVTTLLTQHGITLLSTVDYEILGCRPVSSRTFLAIRLTNVLFHSLVVTTLMAYPVVIAYVVAHQVDVIRGIAAFVAIYSWSIVLTLAVVSGYGALLTVLGGVRLRSLVGYLQLAAGFFAYGGLLLGSRLLRGSSLDSAALPDAWWLVLVPPTWYASYLELAVGVTNSSTMIRGALSIAALTGLSALLRGRLGLDYARRLSELLVATEPVAASSPRTPLFRGGEAHAAAILVLAHFRHDLRVRLGILAIVPLMGLYLVLGANDESVDFVAWAVLLFPALLVRHFATSDDHRASWIYDATPARHGRLVIAVKNIAVAYFLVPFLILVAATLAWREGDVTRGILETLMLGLISHLALQGAMLISPRLPFALPPDKTTGTVSLIAWMTLVILGGQGALYALDRWVYPSAMGVAVSLAALIAASWPLNRAITWRIERLRSG